jgi:hypothetical protein
VCAEEIAHARNLGKRIIPVLYRPIEFDTAPPRLKALNFKIDFTGADEAPPADEAAFAAALDGLCAALDTDVAWHREAARLVTLATRWDNAGRPDDLLLTAADVRAAGTLLERRPAGAEGPGEVLVELRDASRAKLDAEDVKQRRIIGRAFVKPARQAVEEGKHEHALRLAAAGALLARDPGFELVPELWRPAARAIIDGRTRAVLRSHAPVTVASFVTASWDNTARVWDAESGKVIAHLDGHVDSVYAASFSLDGRRVLTRSDRDVRVWNAQSGREIACLEYGSRCGARRSARTAAGS